MPESTTLHALIEKLPHDNVRIVRDQDDVNIVHRPKQCKRCKLAEIETRLRVLVDKIGCLNAYWRETAEGFSELYEPSNCDCSVHQIRRILGNPSGGTGEKKGERK